MSRATLVYADVIDALVEQLPAVLADVEVCDGAPLTNEPGTYLFVGVDDPDTTSSMGAAGVQSWPTSGFADREDEGDIFLAAFAEDGSGDLRSARDESNRAMLGVQDYVRANPTLGIPGVLWLSFSDYSYRPTQDGEGAAVLLFFRLHYTARI